jgi:hypothetical protein
MAVMHLYRRRATAIGLAGALNALAFNAAADPASVEPEPRVDLAWHLGHGAESCGPGDALKRSVESHLGRGVFREAGDPPAKLTIHVEVEARSDPRRLHATVWLEAPEGRDATARELEALGSDCQALSEPLTLVVGLMADTELAREREAEEPPAPAQAPPPRPPAPPPRDEAALEPIETLAPDPEENRPWRVQAGLSLLGGHGLLPAPSAGGELAVQLDPPSFPALVLRAAALSPSSEEIDSAASVTFTLAQGGLALCPALASSWSATLRGCIGWNFGVLHAASHGLSGASAKTRFVTASELALRGRLRLGRGGAFATALLGALLPLRPETFTYDRDGRSEKLFQMAHLAIAAGLGAAYEFR